MHSLPAIDAMNHEVAPVCPADLSLLSDLIVGQFRRAGRIGIECPWTEIHELIVEVGIEALWRLPRHAHNIENTPHFLSLLSSAAAWVFVTSLPVAWRLDFLVDEHTQFAKCVYSMERQGEREYNESHHDDREQCFAKFEAFPSSRRLMTVNRQHVEAFDTVGLLLAMQRGVDWW